MLEYNEILPKKVILMNGAPYEVLDAHVFRKQQRKPVNQTKLRNILTGKVTEQAFHVSEKMQEADITARRVKYMYESVGRLPAGRQEYWFCAENDPKDRFSLPHDVVGEGMKFLKANSVVDALVFDDKIFSIKIPIKVELKVKEAPPAVRGNTAQGGQKQITLETGAIINAPLFINEGDIVRINTELGEYVERAN